MGGKEAKKTVLPIEGMHCASCAVRIEDALRNSKGINAAVVNFAKEKAYVDYDTAVTGIEEMRKTVETLGYGVRSDLLRTRITIGGMHCAACAARIEDTLLNVRGVERAYVNLATEGATIDYHDGEVSLGEIARAVKDAGYEVLEESGLAIGGNEDRSKDVRRRMILAWAFTAPGMILMFMRMFFKLSWPGGITLDLVTIGLAVPVVFVAGWKTIRGAMVAISHRSATMDVLIALGTVVSLATGVASLFLNVANFAGISSMIMAFHLTGRSVEAAAKGRASQAVRRLLELGAKTAMVLDGKVEKQIPAWALKKGDVMVVRPGERIPTDGVVLEGEGEVDESMATGESMPVVRKKGNEVIGGTVGLDGLFKVRVTKVGEETFLSQVVRMVEECQGSKVPIQRFADRITARFVPAVLALAGITFLLWILFPSLISPVTEWGAGFLPWVPVGLDPITKALFACVAVLVIACPCALGLATPTALMVGSGLGAAGGILIKNGEAVQLLKDIDAVVFDKTGTLTIGRLRVTDVLPARGFDVERLVFLAASAESGSEHPAGRAIVRYAQERGINTEKPKRFRAVRGRGVRAQVGGSELLVGSRTFMAENTVDMETMMESLLNLEREKKTTMVVAQDKRAVGIIALQDVLKPGAKKAVEAIERMGIATVMVTGDNRETAAAIARQVGIERVIAGVLPEGKVKAIRTLQAEYGIVAMVGDGINDAPALSQADVGIAIGTGTDIAIEASDITLVRGDLEGVVSAVRLSKSIFRKIKQNLFWAFLYNMLAVPLAVLGLLHPVIAEAAMATSSVSVVTNANLLRFNKIR
jgi:Cu+-exporting ATPase